jgi:hypothetical protein
VNETQRSLLDFLDDCQELAKVLYYCTLVDPCCAAVVTPEIYSSLLNYNELMELSRDGLDNELSSNACESKSYAELCLLLHMKLNVVCIQTFFSIGTNYFLPPSSPSEKDNWW